MAKAVGIDLGTTNSVVAVLEAGEPVVIPNSEGSRTTPSVVAFSKAGEVLVGEVAKRQAITNPDRTFRSVKRHMGENWKSDDIDGKQYTAQEISARILMKLKRDADAYSTLAVEHSTSAFLKLVMECLKSRAPTVTRTLVVTTGTNASSTGWCNSSRLHTELILLQTAWPLSV